MMFFDGGRKLADGPVPLHLRRGPSILAQGEVKPSIIPFHDEVLLPLKKQRDTSNQHTAQGTTPQLVSSS
jgi:hypothetical protein